MPRAHLCDVPGCGRSRKRWQRLCDRCFPLLPGDIRTGLATAHRAQDKPRQRALRRQAGQFMAPLMIAAGLRFAARVNHGRKPTSPQQAFTNAQRLLGEHD